MAEYVSTFTNEKVKDILSKEDVSTDGKIALLLTEHDADVRGLKNKNSEIFGDLKKSKEDSESVKAKITEYEAKIAELEEQIKKNADDNSKEFFENQLAKKDKEYLEKLAVIEKERDEYKTSHLKRLRNDAIQKGIEGLRFVDDTLKEAFVSLVMSKNNFEVKTIDGEVIFLNSENKPIEDVMKEFALSERGKSFIANGNSGGGASSYKGSTATENPWRTGSLAEQTALYKSNPQLAIKMAREVGITLK